MQVYEIDPLSDRRWDALVESDPKSSVFHSSPWLKALKSTYSYTPVVFTTSHRENPLTDALVCCRVESWLTGNRLVSVPFADHCELLSSNPEECERLIMHARQPHARMGKSIEIRPLAFTPAGRNGFAASSTYRVHSLALDRSNAELFKRFHKTSLQQRIRRADREGLKCEAGNSEALLDRFYMLLLRTRRRHGLPPQPLSWFRALIELFGDKLKIRVASKDGVPVASILTLSHKHSMVYKYGCSDARFHSLGGMALLLWHAIQEATDLGMKELDMGRSGCENEGLISFKERFGAVGKSLVYWSYPDPRHAVDMTGHSMMRSVAKVSPDFALKMAGTLLYRHIG
jgi:lipid II:glycine glycyltransferase (peptidoglycan interpeptide bridge formation enzyme)